MQINRNEISIDKELTNLDKFVIDFIKILKKSKVNYVVVSGYVSILFGRSRATEDIDILIPKLNFNEFKKLWDNLNGYQCMTQNVKESYEILKEGSNIRLHKKDKFIPNIELKFSKNELDNYSLEKRFKIKIRKDIIYISPLDLQIPYKLFLGSQKDIEDARFLYQLVKDRINEDKLNYFAEKLKVSKKLKLIK